MAMMAMMVMMVTMVAMMVVMVTMMSMAKNLEEAHQLSCLHSGGACSRQNLRQGGKSWQSGLQQQTPGGSTPAAPESD